MAYATNQVIEKPNVFQYNVIFDSFTTHDNWEYEIINEPLKNGTTLHVLVSFWYFRNIIL